MKTNLTLLFKLSLVLVAASLILTACAPQPAAAVVETAAPIPTVDTDAIVNAVVATVNAQQTEQALLNPTATPLPTNTPAPTATAILDETPAAESTSAPEATATTASANSAELLYVSTFPENKREYLPNELYNVAVGFKNTGSVAWEAGYTLKLVSFTGEATVQLEVASTRAVAPGEKYEFAFWAFGSEMIVRHTWNFQLYTSRGLPVSGGFAAYSYQSITD